MSHFGNHFRSFKAVAFANPRNPLPRFIALLSFVAQVLTRRSSGTSVPLARAFGPSTLR